MVTLTAPVSQLKISVHPLANQLLCRYTVQLVLAARASSLNIYHIYCIILWLVPQDWSLRMISKNISWFCGALVLRIATDRTPHQSAVTNVPLLRRSADEQMFRNWVRLTTRVKTLVGWAMRNFEGPCNLPLPTQNNTRTPIKRKLERRIRMSVSRHSSNTKPNDVWFMVHVEAKRFDWSGWGWFVFSIKRYWMSARKEELKALIRLIRFVGDEK